jgi:phage anti-repressor protein
MIDARALQGRLGQRSDKFHRWVNDRIEDYGFVAGEDFTTVVSKTGGRPRLSWMVGCHHAIPYLGESPC